MAGDKGKKPKIAEKTVDDAQQIDADLIQSIEKMQELQDELEKKGVDSTFNRDGRKAPNRTIWGEINEEASDKVLEIEHKYNEIRKPVYDKRNEIIKSIPDFWPTAFLSHPVLSDLLSEEDQKIFKHLTSLEVEDFKDVKLGYSISFNFGPNPYFDDTKLTKTFTFLDEGTTKVTATSIKWKEGKGVSNGVCHEKKGNKRCHDYHVDDSFFSWFNGNQEKDEVEEFHDEVAEIIREDLWTNPLTYFNNDADEEEFGDEEEDGTDDSEEDEDQEDDEGK